MTIRRFLIPLLFFLLNATFAQTDSTNNLSSKTIVCADEKGLVKGTEITKYETVKVWIKGEEKPIKGNLTIVNDSTLMLNQRILPIQDIEKIRVAHYGLLGLGALLFTGGVTLGTLGIVTINKSSGSTELRPRILYGALGTITVLTAGTLTTAGLFLLTNTILKMDMKNSTIRVIDKCAYYDY
ncbi:MAG: hypothetical protein ACI8ZM_002333 [Crocinitomix sp.]|jgi:hypothetical protein